MPPSQSLACSLGNHRYSPVQAGEFTWWALLCFTRGWATDGVMRIVGHTPSLLHAACRGVLRTELTLDPGPSRPLLSGADPRAVGAGSGQGGHR